MAVRLTGKASELTIKFYSIQLRFSKFKAASSTIYEKLSLVMYLDCEIIIMNMIKNVTVTNV